MQTNTKPLLTAKQHRLLAGLAEGLSQKDAARAAGVHPQAFDRDATDDDVRAMRADLVVTEIVHEPCLEALRRQRVSASWVEAFAEAIARNRRHPHQTLADRLPPWLRAQIRMARFDLQRSAAAVAGGRLRTRRAQGAR